MPGDLSDKLETVHAWCKRLAKPAEPTELTMEDGSEATVLEIEHGDHEVWAIDGPGEVVDLVYSFYLTDEEIDRLAEMDDQDYQALVTDLEMALLEGRSAYRFYLDADDRLSGFSVTQVLHVPEESGAGQVQRFHDAVQEIVVTALRGANMLGLPWSDVDRAHRPGGGEPHAGMYG